MYFNLLNRFELFIGAFANCVKNAHNRKDMQLFKKNGYTYSFKFKLFIYRIFFTSLCTTFQLFSCKFKVEQISFNLKKVFNSWEISRQRLLNKPTFHGSTSVIPHSCFSVILKLLWKKIYNYDNIWKKWKIKMNWKTLVIFLHFKVQVNFSITMIRY